MAARVQGFEAANAATIMPFLHRVQAPQAIRETG